MTQFDESKAFGLLIADLSRLLRRVFDARMKDKVPVSSSQWYVLVRLWQNDGLSQSELAERVEIEQSSLVRHLDNLEAQGFINRKIDENDRRSNRVYLTESSKPLFEKVFTQIAQPLRRELLADLSEDEYVQMVNSLRKIKGNAVCLLEQILAGASHEKA